MEQKTIPIRMPTALHEKLRGTSYSSQLSMSEITRRALILFFEEYDKSGKGLSK